MRALALTIMLLPSVAFAQVPAPLPPLPPEDDPGECTVTTTVRCTGAAAPYAVQAAQPQPPIVIQAPAPPSPPSPPPTMMMMPPPGTILLDPRQLGNGWRLVQSPDGCLWRERKVSSDAPGVWGTGLAFWLGGYAAGVIGGMEQGDANILAWWPIIGAFANIAVNSGNGTAQTLWAIDGLAQAGGFVTFLVGLAAGPAKMQRLPLTVSGASFAGGGSGVALAGRF